jgi:hypothetical protein
MPIIKNLTVTTSDNVSIHIEKMTCSMEELFSIMKMDKSNHTTQNMNDAIVVNKSVESKEDDEECVIKFETSSPHKLKSGTTEYNKSYYERKKNDPDFKEKCRLRGKLQYLKKKDDPATKEKKRQYNKLYRERKLLEKQQNETSENESA